MTSTSPARFEPLGGQLYRRGAHFYGRFTLAGGRRKWHRLAAITVKHAREEIPQLEARHRQAAAGLVVNGAAVVDPFAPKRREPSRPTVARLLTRWLAVDCPDIKRRPRPRHRIERELEPHIAQLIAHLGEREPETLTLRDCLGYFDRRTEAAETAGRITLRRTVDMELTTLSNCLHWAATLPPEEGGIRFNPLATGRPRFQEGRDVRHSRECMPASGDQFHQLAAWCFDSRRSEVFGWMILLAGLTGCRIGELRGLRWDARRLSENHIEPGHLTATDLYVLSEKARGRAQAHGQHVRRIPLVDPELPADCPSRGLLPVVIDRLRAWHRLRHPLGSDWWFPGKLRGQPVSETALNHALRDACTGLQIPHIIPHGLRAFYTTVMRRWKVADGLISSRLGQVSGEKLIQAVYGKDLGNIAPEMDWLPQTEPKAWEYFAAQHQPASNVVNLHRKTA